MLILPAWERRAQTQWSPERPDTTFYGVGIRRAPPSRSARWDPACFVNPENLPTCCLQPRNPRTAPSLPFDGVIPNQSGHDNPRARSFAKPRPHTPVRNRERSARASLFNTNYITLRGRTTFADSYKKYRRGERWCKDMPPSRAGAAIAMCEPWWRARARLGASRRARTLASSSKMGRPCGSGSPARRESSQEREEMESIQSVAPGVAAAIRRREALLLLILASVQFTSIVDFMIVMPLGPSA